MSHNSAKQRVKLEICIDNIDAAVQAINGGADRLEICSSLAEGGLTPSFGLVQQIRQKLPAAVIYAMLRCKSGSDFIYSPDDLEVMLNDLKAFKLLGVNGFVFGALKSDRAIDRDACEAVISSADPLPVTFHRAFDVCRDPMNSIDDLIEMGFERVLTSGCQPKATSDEARVFIKRLLDKIGDRIIIMPGSGINPDNVRSIVDLGATEVHASCLVKREVINDVNMGKNVSESIYTLDRSRVEEIVSILKSTV